MTRLCAFFLLLTTCLAAPLSAARADDYCAFDQIHEQMLEQDPGYRERLEKLEKDIQHAMGLRRPRSEAIYTIPLVVHVIHQGEAEGVGSNISDDQIRSAIVALNKDYRKIAGSNGDGDGVDIGVEFCLAVRDPDDQPHDGIVRIDNSADAYYLNNGIDAFVNDSNTAAIKGLSRWPRDDYYNIWIVNKIDGANGDGTQGFATSPAASPEFDGTVVLANAFGTTGNLKSFTDLNRTVTHELGHGFNLLHTFEGGSCAVEDNCSIQGDLVCDTPPTILNQSCDPACNGAQQVENYMDYTPEDCQNMFTGGQKARMRAAISVSRSTLLTSDGCVPVVTPVSDFSAPSPTCAGEIPFTDRSSDGPTGWEWSFPGGTPSSSNDSEPIITYAPGFYDISLTATNTIGTGTTATKEEYLAVYAPPPAACSVETQDIQNYIYYIANFTFNTIDSTTGNTIDDNGSLHRTCSDITTLQPETDYPVSITTGGNDTNVRVYIDYDNDGDFSGANELAFASDSPLLIHTGTITIPAAVVTDTILRLRVISDQRGYAISPCSNPHVGQAEDYGILIQPQAAPVTDFAADNPAHCSGAAVTFHDQSANGSSQWSWSFPGGSPATANDSQPVVTYSVPGIYDAGLTAANSIGTGLLETKNNYIEAFTPPAASCDLTPVNIGHYGMGIERFLFHTIDKITGDTNIDGGSLDFTCSEIARVTPGATYPVTITTEDNDSDIRIFLDIDNDGDVSRSSELLFSSDDNGPVHTGTVTIPATIRADTVLRMQVVADFVPNPSASDILPCAPPIYGQAEQYGIAVIPQVSPTTRYSTPTPGACLGNVQFYDNSLNGVSGWQWQFPDGTPGSSTEQNPLINYPSPGYYPVSLATENRVGAGREISGNDALLVSYPPAAACYPTTRNLDAEYGIGIFQVQIGDTAINHTSTSAYGDNGNLDLTCLSSTELLPNHDYTATVTVASGNAENVAGYIDYNNDGDFNDSGENIFTSSVAGTGSHVLNFTTPASPVTTNTLLRFRVISDFWPLQGPCASLAYGQAEDYSVFFRGPYPAISLSAPSAAHTGNDTVSFTVSYSDAVTITLTADDISVYATGTASGVVSVTEAGQNSRTITVSSITGNGSLRIALAYGTATDTSGQFSLGAVSIPFIVDNTPPAVSITSPAANFGYNTTTVPLLFDINDSSYGTTLITLDGQVISLNNGDNIEHLTNGSHTLTIAHTDLAGNTSTDSRIFSITRGDLNKDGSVDLRDVLFGLKILVGITPETTPDTGKDLNQDGRVGIAEIFAILQFIAGIRQ